MTRAYVQYLEHLAHFAASNMTATAIAQNEFPQFLRLKKRIQEFRSTIEKYDNVQQELIQCITNGDFDVETIDVVSQTLRTLEKIDKNLSELVSKRIAGTLRSEVKQFSEKTYATASLWRLERVEEEIFAYHNRVAEITKREQKESEDAENQTRTLIGILVVGVVVVALFAMCNA